MENMPKSDMKNGNVTHWHLGNLALPCHLEESASHHVLITLTSQHDSIVRQHKESVSEVPIWSEETSSRNKIP